jgi:hypothetical protein
MTTSSEVRTGLVNLLRRDLFGPHPDQDVDLAREILSEKPSRWYVGGFIVPAHDGVASAPADDEEVAERAQDDLLASETLESPIESDADEQETPDQPPKDRYMPSSIGLTPCRSPTPKIAAFALRFPVMAGTAEDRRMSAARIAGRIFRRNFPRTKPTSGSARISPVSY